ncbi:MAG: translation initiation factor IF-2 [Bacteroidales bacterium]
MGTENSGIRLSKIARVLNVGRSTIVDFLEDKGFSIGTNPNAKIPDEACRLLEDEFKKDLDLKAESKKVHVGSKKESLSLDEADSDSNNTPDQTKEEEILRTETPKASVKIVGKIDFDKPKPKEEEKTESTEEKKDTVKEVEIEKEEPIETPKETEKKKEPKKKVEPEAKTEEKNAQKDVPLHVKTNIPKVEKVKVVGKIDLSSIDQRTRPQRKTKEEKAAERASQSKENAKKKRKRIDNRKVDPTAEKNQSKGQHDNNKKQHPNQNSKANQKNVAGKKRKKHVVKKDVAEEDVEKQMKETLARLTSKGNKSGKGAKYRREKRQANTERMIAEAESNVLKQRILKVTEFVSVSEIATMMDVGVTDVISTCMSLGLFVSINQRLDADTISVVADEFGFELEFVSVDIQESIGINNEEEVDESKLQPRPPIVTVMGHVDHGKTSLLDYIRSANVIAGEAGGITQHIGAYHVKISDGRKITFLDTPGHEAFTAMRARGAQVTDIAIIIVAADDSVMPQTREAINHAQAAGVPIIFAINKIDKPGANPEKIKENLASMNYLVEDWGGKYQSQDISAKSGQGIEELLEKVLLEADLLDLKANPSALANGTIIESELDKGRGYVSTVLVESGTLRQGDVILAGQYFGHVKAMFNERNQRIQEAKPAEPAIILGLNGAPQAGDNFNVMEEEREARNIATKRSQLQREQGLRTQKHITLDEIGRRIAIGNFQELNIIVKGDVDGSTEALSDSLIKLSTEEIQVNVIHKGVGQISESDIMLASASNAIVVGFQVRPSLGARKLAESEEIDIRLYSIIYDAIEEIKSAMEGMLAPEIKEQIVGTVEILETFKISKVGTIAGCIVRDGKINRNSKVRIIRDGIVIYTGKLASLKRFKDDAKEVAKGFECGLNIDGFNDIKVNDMVEAYEEVEVAKHL